MSLANSTLPDPVPMSPPRLKMIEQQIRTWDVLDERVLRLYHDLARENFVDPAQRGLAYADLQLPCGEGQVMLEPKQEGRMLQELAPLPSDTVLHIGAGSGFFLALLSRLCKHVVSYEIRPELAARARLRLDAAGINNVEVVTGDGFANLVDHDLVHSLVLSGSVPTVPAALLAKLKPNGRLLAPIGTAPILSLRLFTRTAKGHITKDILEMWVPPLDNAPQPSRFSF